MPTREEIDEILGGIVIEKHCKHHCVCGCHKGRNPVTHNGTCCTPCTKGHQRIRNGTILAHLMECHGQTMYPF